MIVLRLDLYSVADAGIRSSVFSVLLAGFGNSKSLPRCSLQQCNNHAFESGFTCVIKAYQEVIDCV